MSLSAEETLYITQMLYSESGIDLGPDKGYLLETRLSELCKSLGLPTMSALVERLRARKDGTVAAVVEAMTTNETSFFRDVSPYEGLRNTVLPNLFQARKNDRSLRIWSAACSTGQEPYSLAMTLDEFRGQTAGWNVRLLATDLADKVLTKAREGQYTQFEVNRGLSAVQLVRYFRKKGSLWVFDDKLRQQVEFRQMNLLSVPRGLGPFDIIWCRNVLIYFDEETKRKVLMGLLANLAPDGYLFLGSSEVLLGQLPGMERIRLGTTSCCYCRSAAVLQQSA